MRFSLGLSVGLIFLCLTGCGTKVPQPLNSRLTIQKFDNQSGRAADAWISTAVAQSLLWNLIGDGKLTPSVAANNEEVRENGAGLLIYGTLRRSANGDALRFDAQVTDASTGRIIETIQETEGESTLLDLTSRVARRLKATYGVRGELQTIGPLAAWKAYAEAISEEQLAKLSETHPDFAPGILALAEFHVRSGQPLKAAGLNGKFPPTGASAAFARTQYNVLMAPDPAARLIALESLIVLRRDDLRLHEQAAQIAVSLGLWDKVALHRREAIRVDPANLNSWNELGYAEARQGRTDEAVKAMREYQRLAPTEPNPLDSLAEVQYMGRRFKEAGVSFDELSGRFPAFQQGQARWKSAFAWWRAGDLKAADERHAQWLRVAAPNATPSTVVFQRSYWLARTGRAKELDAFLEREIATSAGERKAAAEMHRALFRFGLTALGPSRNDLTRWSPALATPALKNELATFALLSQPAASEAEWRQRIASSVPTAQLSAVGPTLLNAARQIWAPLPEPKTPAPKTPESLPEGPPTVIDAMLLRHRIAVLR